MTMATGDDNDSNDDDDDDKILRYLFSPLAIIKLIQLCG